MIKNEKQFQNTKKYLKDFKEVWADYEKNGDRQDLLTILEMNAVSAKIGKFEEEIDEYIKLQDGTLNTIILNSLDKIPEILIKARIAKKWTQANLASRLGIKEQQIQKYESTDYAGASIGRLQKIIDALGITIPATTISVK